jgi:uncharacterized RDD family membrane protein YckC
VPTSLSRRLIGYLVDCLVLLASLLVLHALLYSVNPILRDGTAATAGQVHLWVFATATLPSLLYFALMVSSGRQATLGMRVLGLRVEGVDGSRVGFPRALARSAVLLVPFEINHTLMFRFASAGDAPSILLWIGIALVWVLIGLFLLSVLVSPRRQSLHDRVAGTVVIWRPALTKLANQPV